ncbi:alpha/beta fold hydrolase [Paenibacillus sp. NEAU-GSW1]|uniref:alpha/beta fold hydrolase n=1 Tax=Paenibacillus sp. NEAU-GSW1 TaxID=2682486 RepID=UPI0012E23D83|nr:alpha/beta hydrolase [Paenibacillus sp. NEAU-GSW1]MUT64604.1 alpha/beta fold hydrolase [Paenibacillus sp. NEAU-GSW1]
MRNLFKTKAGLVLEYTVLGHGEPVLVMHGGHSNCYEEFGYDELLARNYSIITPSRPGYGLSAKAIGHTLETACEAYIELLDYLRIQKIHVVAISAGGPSGIVLASRFPERVRSLVLQSAVTHTWLTPKDSLYQTARFMFRPTVEKYLWSLMRLLHNWIPSAMFKHTIVSFSKRPKKEILPQFSAEDRELYRRMLNRQRSGHGFLLDLEQTGNDWTAAISTIQCPVLILHSKYDGLVPLEHARYAERHIAKSRLYELESWGHLIWLGEGAPDMYREWFAFLDQQRA